MLWKVLKEELGERSDEIVILDGYPRNVAQAETLKDVGMVHPVRACLHLDVDRAEIVSRLSGRRVCSGCGASYHLVTNPPKTAGICNKCSGSLIQRSDDDAKSIAVRLDVYDRNTEPVLEWYRKRSLYRKVKGSGSTEEIFEELQKAVGSSLH